MPNKIFKILLVGDSNERYRFARENENLNIENNLFSIDTWAAQDTSQDLQIAEYIESYKKSHRNKDFAIIYFAGAKEKHIEIIEKNKDSRWVTKTYNDDGHEDSAREFLREITLSPSQPFFMDVFKGNNSVDLKGTKLDEIPVELHSNINKHLSCMLTEKLITQKIPSLTTVFQGKDSQKIDNTVLGLIPRDLHSTINYYLLFKPLPKMELSDPEILNAEQKNSRTNCIIS